MASKESSFFPTADVYRLKSRLAWPDNPPGWTYLGEAVDAVGRAIYPDWSEDDPICEMPEVLIAPEVWQICDTEEENARQLSYARKLLVRNGHLEIEPGSSFRQLSDEDWAAAVEFSRQEWQIAIAARNRFWDVQRVITRAAERGEVKLGMRPVYGGEITVCPQSWSSTEHFSGRYQWLRIDPRQPFADRQPEYEKSCDLFLDARGLRGLVTKITLESSQAAPETKNVSDRVLSPYIRLLLQVIEALDIRPDNQPKKDVVMAELRRLWTGEEPLSENLVGVMATIAREPASQLGKANKQG